MYPTDDERENKQLAYYRQREWRIVSGVFTSNVAQSRTLNSAEKDALIDVDPSFWTREIQFENLSTRRVDEAQVINSFGGRDLAAIIRRVIVPKAVLPRVEELFPGKAFCL